MEKNDDDMMNLPKSLHGEDMSLTNWMINMTLTRSCKTREIPISEKRAQS